MPTPAGCWCLWSGAAYRFFINSTAADVASRSLDGGQGRRRWRTRRSCIKTGRVYVEHMWRLWSKSTFVCRGCQTFRNHVIRWVMITHRGANQILSLKPLGLVLTLVFVAASRRSFCNANGNSHGRQYRLILLVVESPISSADHGGLKRSLLTCVHCRGYYHRKRLLL